MPIVWSAKAAENDDVGEEVISVQLQYREFHLLANLGWVDFGLGCSTILLGQ